MNYSNLSNEQLLQLLKSNDKVAFHAIYKLFWKECFLIAYQKLNSKTLAEEATQNIFISLWERRNQVEIQNLKAYLRTSVKYQVINLIKQKLSTAKHLPSFATQNIAHNNAEDLVFYNELMDALEKAVNDLPQKTGTIYRLSRCEYLTGKEIASRMGLSEKSVEYHITQALKYLRIELKDYLTYSIALLFLSNFL